MKLFVLGLSFKTAPIEVRERVAFPSEKDDARQALQRMVDAPAVREGLIVSTCNRVELYGVGPKEDDGIAALRSFLSSFHGITAVELDEHLYSHAGDDAIAHLFRVASSLDSMVIGEPQITGQVKEAYRVARDAGTIGTFLHKTMHRTFQVAKRVRTETAIAQNAVSISYAAVELAKKIFGDLGGRAAMLVGAGKMGELSAKHLYAQGVREVLVANRTYERAVELAKGFDGTPVPMEKVPRYLELADIVIYAATADGFLLDRQRVQQVIKARRYRPMFIIDISMPRIVDPQINEIGGIYLYDIDNLRGVVEENLSERTREAKRGELIVSEEQQRFSEALAKLRLAPTIAEFNRKLAEIADAEMQRTKELANLDEAQRKAIGRMMKSMVKKIAHDPIRTLHDEHESGNGFFYMESLSRLFNLPAPEIAGDDNDDDAAVDPAEADEAADSEDVRK